MTTDRVQDAVATTAYYVAAEAVANALKHAGSRRLLIEVARDGGTLSVSVSDDGCGGASIVPGRGLGGCGPGVRERRDAARPQRPGSRYDREGVAAVRIVIGEDSALYGEGMAKLLADAGHDIVAKVGDAAAVVAAVERWDPDLLITDIRMPPTMTDDGARAARTLRAERPTLPIVLLSQHVETTHSLEAGRHRQLRLPAQGPGSRRRGLPGRSTGSRPAVPRSTRTWSRPSWPPTRATDPLASLTERELEVLSLLAEGRSNAAIARQLWTTRRTIETHVRHVFAKLGLLDSDSDSRRVVAVLVYLRNRGGR